MDDTTEESLNQILLPIFEGLKDKLSTSVRDVVLRKLADQSDESKAFLLRIEKTNLERQVALLQKRLDEVEATADTLKRELIESHKWGDKLVDAITQFQTQTLAEVARRQAPPGNQQKG